MLRWLIVAFLFHTAVAVKFHTSSFGLLGGSGSHFHYKSCDEEPVGCPANWGDLDIPNNQCDSTKRQSPIHLPSARSDAPAPCFDITPNYAAFHKLILVNTGHTIEIDSPAGVENTVSVNWGSGTSAKYKLVQFHFHTRSEHTVAGQRYPLEIHLVHQLVEPVEGAEPVLVLGAFFRHGHRNPFLEAFIDNMPDIPEEGKNVFKSNNATIDLNLLFSTIQSSRFWSYRGSLTTPPCTESVQWVVLIQPAGTVSTRELAKIAAKIPGGANARPVQPLGSEQDVKIHRVNVVNA